MTVADGRRSRPDRRSVLKGALGAAVCLPGLALHGSAPARAQFKTDPFTLGVASGEPAADGFVIWTRLAPEPLRPRGGLPTTPIEVTWELSDDPGLKQVIRSGRATARIEAAHSVHVEIDGLAPGRDYFYRFRAGDAQSPVGRARTFPAAGADVPQLRFGVAGCQSWEGGFYTAWRKIA